MEFLLSRSEITISKEKFLEFNYKQSESIIACFGDVEQDGFKDEVLSYILSLISIDQLKLIDGEILSFFLDEVKEGVKF